LNDNWHIPSFLAWVVVGLIAVLKSRDPAQRGAGLAIMFVVNMALNHWFGALVCVLPWYSPSSNDFVTAGFELSTLGMIGFAVGCFAIAPIVFPGHRGDEELAEATGWHPRALRTYALVGVGSILALMAGAGRIPTVSAVCSTGFSFMLVAVCLAIWCAYQRGEQTRVYGWLAVAFVLPFFTMVTQGFLGMGIGYLIVVISFYLLLSRHRAALLLMAVPLMFLGLSLYVSYIRDRGELRRVVWNGGAYDSRVDQVLQMCRNIEWFDPFNTTHLARIDGRLNQNRLVGAAALRLQHTQGYARGETFWMAVLALVPRAIWSNKPQYAGGMDLVSRYTGLTFAQGTSVGMGPIFELEINFGSIGVFLGMVFIGMFVGVADRKAGASLRLDDPLTFGKWFLIGLILQNVNGSFAEITASLAAGLLLIVPVNRYLRSRPDLEFPHPMDEHPANPVNA
jgi:hypothetical protein